MIFALDEVSLSIEEKEILSSISLSILEQKFIGLIGPNGSGKSSLLKLMYKYIKPTTGQILLMDRELHTYKEKFLSKNLAVVTQESPFTFDFTVKEIVVMGRTPYKKVFSKGMQEDEKIVHKSMEQANIIHLANRSYSSLSGGEKKRVVIARALAQKTDVLILDEPTNHLDIEHQLQLMDLLKDLPITVITALHDLNLAATYCDEVIMLKNGRLMAFGSPVNVLTESNIQQVFHIESEVSIHPLTKKPYIQFISNRFRRELSK